MLFVSLIGLAEGSQLAAKLGLDASTFFEVASVSSGESWPLRTWYPVPGVVPTSPANRNFDATFSTVLAEKDLSFALAAGDHAGLHLPAAHLALEQFERLIDEGFGGKDCSLIVKYASADGSSRGSTRGVTLGRAALRRRSGVEAGQRRQPCCTAAMTSVRRSRSAPSSSRLMPSRSTTCGGIARACVAQRAPSIGEGDVERALVAGAALAGEVALRLEALEQRRERRGLELQRLAEVAHGARAALPEREHDEVLRVREAERLEDRPVDADDAAGGDGEGEAHLVLEGEQVVGCRGSAASAFVGVRSCVHGAPV